MKLGILFALVTSLGIVHPADASPDLTVTAKPFIESIAPTHQLYSSLLRFADAPTVRASMVAGTDDGAFVAASRRTPTPKNEYAVVPTVYRLDQAGGVRWAVNVGDPGFVTFELMSVVATPDGGAIVQVLAYKHAARNPNTRFVKLDRQGARTWTLQLPGTGNTDCPHAEIVRPDGKGGLAIHGYWVRASELTDRHDWAGHLRHWYGAVSADGKLVRSEVGAVMPKGPMEAWPEPAPAWDALTRR